MLVNNCVLQIPCGKNTEAVEIVPIGERQFVLKNLMDYENLLELLLRFNHTN